MTGPSFAIVVTSVHDGSFLPHYFKALEGADARMYVIPDRKTPRALYEAVEQEFCKGGTLVFCPDPDTQTRMLERLGAPEGFFPWDTDHRRNVGYLMAYESGADIVISVDDDNLPEPGWLDEHAWAGEPPAARRLVGSDSGFWNPCDLLVKSPSQFWPRGFPYGRRHSARHPMSDGESGVAINSGLWIGDPDVDAVTRLAMAPSSGAVISSVVLAADTWAPVNSQNTAVRREVIPAYYFFRSPRFGDIYQGYLAQACAKHLGHSVRFGTPVVRHERNDHDLLKDLEAELPDIMVLDRWLDWLTQARPEGSTYSQAYESLAIQMATWARESEDELVWPIWNQKVFEMTTWLQLCRRIG